MWLYLSGPMFSRLSSFKKLLLLACFERVCLGGCSLMSSYLTVDTSHEKLETNSDKEKESHASTVSGRRRGTCSASSIFLDSTLGFMIQFQAMVGYQKSHFSWASLGSCTYRLTSYCMLEKHPFAPFCRFVSRPTLIKAKWACFVHAVHVSTEINA